jgi:amidohydrolase
MASMDDFSVRIYGHGGHAAMPDSGVDAILISAQVITALQSIISKEVSPLLPVVLHVGQIKGGDAFNIIADLVEFHGTVRTLDKALQSHMPERMERVIQGVTQALRGSHELDYRFGYPPVVNEPRMTEMVRREAEDILGREMVIEIPANMISDDMAYYQQEVPGCYFLLGVGNKKKKIDHPYHHSRFNLDEDALPLGVEAMIRCAKAYLS